MATLVATHLAGGYSKSQQMMRLIASDIFAGASYSNRTRFDGAGESQCKAIVSLLPVLYKQITLKREEVESLH